MDKMPLKVLLCVLVVVCVCVGPTWASPSAKCLDCICHASSGCKSSIRCHNTGAGQYFCGPYQISWAYWADAGKPGFTGFSNDFENCLVDKNCAEATVRGYMAKWGTDCNGDGRLDCADYAAIHKAGPTGCNQQWLLDSKYWTQFNQCYSAPLHASAAPSISPPFRATSGNPANTIIEIPQPRPPRPALAHSSAVSSSGSSGAFGPSPPPLHSSAVSSSGSSIAFGPSRPPLHSTFTSSSSFSRHNFSHSEVEITESESETVNSNSNSFSSSSNRAPALPSFTSSSSSFPARPPLPPLPSFTSSSSNSFSSPPLPPLPNFASSPSHSYSSPAVPSYKPPPPQPPLVVSNPQPSSTRGEEAALTTFGNVKPANFNPLVPQDCLECLCQASSKCDLNKGCDGAYCGPYLLSWGYWADGGKPGGDYPSCAKDKACSELAVQGYMNKWNKDCNRDGIVDCADFALIHKLGPHACGKVEAIQVTDYWKNYESCNAPTEVEDRNPSERSIVSSVSVNTIPGDAPSPNRFIGPLKPEVSVESEEANFAQPPLPRPSVPSANSFATNLISNQPESPSVRISFNNREVVNTAPTSRVPPATVHHHPHHHHHVNPLPPPPPLPVRVPPAPQPAPIATEVSQPANINSNIISNSPLARPSFGSPPPPAPITEPSNRFVPARPLEPVTNADERAPEPASPAWSSSPNSGFSAPPRESEVDRAPIRHHPKPASNSTANGIISQECLECICHASSRCSASIGCVSDSSGKFICGPYQVSWEYWTEAGKPGNRADLSNLENFQQCMSNRQCADETVRGYMHKLRKDCNDDGAITCDDLAALHVAGPLNCNAQWYLDSQYYSDFRSCNDFRRR